jgi:RNA polymerase sigma-70 factor (ECF subfamily)
MPESDAALVKSTLLGSQAAFDLLTERYTRRISALVYQKVGNSGDAEDLVQESFMKAYAALGQLKNPERFGPWLYQIAGMTVIDFLRRKRSRHAVSLDEMKVADYELPAAIQEPLDRELFEKVMKAVGGLPENYRLVFTLRFLEGMSGKDIAEHLGEPHGTVRNRLFRAIEMIRKEVGEF